MYQWLDSSFLKGSSVMKNITIGIIGAGRIGRLHAENLLKIPEVAIKAVSDVQVESATEWASRIGIPKVTKDYKEIINDSEIDAVYICSTTDTHVQIIRDAAIVGKHIFCEKPISFDITTTREALKLVHHMGVKLQVGFNRRFDHNFRRIRELVQMGKIGSPHIIKITSRDPAPPPVEYIKVSGGLFLDMTIHDFDIARFVSGSDVEEVYATGAVLVDSAIRDAGDIDTAVITLKFKNGAVGVIDNSRKAVYGYDQRVEVFGSLGCVSIQNDFPNTAELSTGEGIIRDKPKYFFLDRYAEAYLEESKAFIDSILANKPVPVDGNDGLQAELMAHAAKKSLTEGRPVAIDEIE
jgi:myo-inositol 2-dehydrogenase / D-chiro-inositol 1-dehydrogenase